jgi:hypothetical protein
MSKKEQLSTLTEDDLRRINSEAGILELLKSRNYNVEKILIYRRNLLNCKTG